MGLDIYFHKTNRSEWAKVKSKIDQPGDGQSNPTENFDPEEIGYFRKVNFLMSFFNYEGNCEYKEIARCELEDLRDACVEISKMKPVRVDIKFYTCGGKESVEKYSRADQQRCSELLPTTSGFFFGSTDYDQRYFHDVKEVLVWVDGVLSDLADNEVVLMYCWW